MPSFKMGRKRPVARSLRFSLHNYLKRNLPPAPDRSNDLILPARDSLKQVYLNDELACCTASAAFHIEYLMLAAAGQPATGLDEDVREFYSRTTGYVPGRSETDQGGDEDTVLNYWRENGLLHNRRQIAGHLRVEGSDKETLKSAIWLFENVYFGVEMPNDWIDPFPDGNGFVWDVAGPPNPENGHAFAGIGYDERGIYIATWGMVGLMTWRAIKRYGVQSSGGEIHTVLSPDSLVRATKKTPHGFDWSQLVADFDSAGGNVRSVLAAE
jgi:hypothetical protein